VVLKNGARQTAGLNSRKQKAFLKLPLTSGVCDYLIAEDLALKMAGSAGHF